MLGKIKTISNVWKLLEILKPIEWWKRSTGVFLFFFFTFIYLFIMFCCYQYSWLSILLMGSITVVCFMCRVRIFNDTCNILLYIILEVLMTSKCNFVTCNILFHLVLMIGQIYYIELNGYESGLKKKQPRTILLRIYRYRSSYICQ